MGAQEKLATALRNDADALFIFGTNLYKSVQNLELQLSQEPGPTSSELETQINAANDVSILSSTSIRLTGAKCVQAIIKP